LPTALFIIENIKIVLPLSLSSINRIDGGLLSAEIAMRDRQSSEVPIIHSRNCNCNLNFVDSISHGRLQSVVGLGLYE